MEFISSKIYLSTQETQQRAARKRSNSAAMSLDGFVPLSDGISNNKMKEKISRINVESCNNLGVPFFGLVRLDIPRRLNQHIDSCL